MRRQPVLSCLEARDLVCSGCSTFLACLVSLSVEESADSRAPYDVPIVSEFVDVFPEELPGLPLTGKSIFLLTLFLALLSSPRPRTVYPRQSCKN